MDIKKLDAVIKAVSGSGTTRFELKSKNFRLKLVKNSGLGAAPKTRVEKKAPSIPSPSLDIKTLENLPPSFIGDMDQGAEPRNENDLVSFHVGFFSRFNPKTKRQYVKLRDSIKKGDTIGVITSMHVEHEVLAEQGGKIVQFLVEEGQPVEYGQPLMRLDDEKSSSNKSKD